MAGQLGEHQQVLGQGLGQCGQLAVPRSVTWNGDLCETMGLERRLVASGRRPGPFLRV